MLDINAQNNQGCSGIEYTLQSSVEGEKLSAQVSIVYPQFKFHEIQNDYLNQILLFFAGVELKEMYFSLTRQN